MNFFITGLPRCRSAWLANFMTFGDTHCFHDVLLDCPRVDQLSALFEATGLVNVGASDPALVIFHKRIMEIFPKAKWVVVLRDVYESIQSSHRAFGSKNDLTHGTEVMQGKLEELIRDHKPMVVDFDKLNSRLAMAIAQYCVPGFRSTQKRNQLLERMNVQTDPKILKADIAMNPKCELNEGGLVWV